VLFTVRVRSGQSPERLRTVPLIVVVVGTGVVGVVGVVGLGDGLGDGLGVGAGDGLGVGAGVGEGAGLAAASCTTIYGWPPMTAWPTRCGPLLAATRKPTTVVELPVGFATTSQPLSLDVDHAHPVNV